MVASSSWVVRKRKKTTGYYHNKQQSSNAGRNGTRRDANDTGNGSNGIDAGDNNNAGSNGYSCYYVLSLFLYFHLFFISLFFFSDYFFSGKYNNKRGTKGKRRTDGTSKTGPTGTPSSMCMLFWLSSFILIILLLFQLSLFQWSITTGGQDGVDQCERRSQQRTERGGSVS